MPDMKGHQTKVSESGSCDNAGNVCYTANSEHAQQTSTLDPIALKNDPQIKVDMHFHQNNPPTQACPQQAKQKEQTFVALEHVTLGKGEKRKPQIQEYDMCNLVRLPKFGQWDSGDMEPFNMARTPILNERYIAERAHTLRMAYDGQVYGGGRRLTADQRSSSSSLRDVSHAPQELPSSGHKVRSESASPVSKRTLQATTNGITAFSHQSTRDSSSRQEKEVAFLGLDENEDAIMPILEQLYSLKSSCS